jgi:hypothetical protein
MSQITGSFSLNGTLAGQSDPVSINTHSVVFDVDNPSVTSGTTITVNGTPFVVFTTTGVGATDNYVYIRNTGTGGALTGTGKVNVQIEHLSGNNVDVLPLEVGDFFFGPIKGGTGVTCKYDTAETTFVYAYFKRI